jgi:hypothetical protein
MYGKGKYKFSDGKVFDGEFRYNMVHGKGKQYDPMGVLVQEGNWELDVFVGEKEVKHI